MMISTSGILSTGEKKCSPMKRVGSLDALREARDGQRGGVAAHQQTRRAGGLGLLRDLGLQAHALEHGLDDHVAAREPARLGGGLDERERGVRRLTRHGALRHALLEDLGGVGLALLGALERDVLQHTGDAHGGRGVGDALPHHASAQDAHLLGERLRDVLRTAGAAADLLQVEEERLDHVLRDAAGGELHEVAALDALRGVEVHLRALDGGAHDGARRRVVRTLQLLLQVGRERRQVARELGVAGRAAGHLVALGVPGLRGLRVGGDERTRLRQHVVGVLGQLVDEAGGERLRGLEARTLDEHVHDGLLHAEQAHGAHDAAAAGQQAERDLGQAQLDARVVEAHAVVTCERDLEATAEGGAVDGGHHGHAQRLERAQLSGDLAHVREHVGGVLGLRLAQHLQVAAGEEGLLGGGQDHALHGARLHLALEPRHGALHGLLVELVHGVRGLVGVVHRQRDDAVLAQVPADCGLLSHVLCTFRVSVGTQMRSMMVAMPMPPPTHSVARP
jgi:hypothetical protein